MRPGHDTFPQAGRYATFTAYAVAPVVGAIVSYVTLELEAGLVTYWVALAIAIVILVAVALPLTDRSRHRERLIEAERRKGTALSVDSD